MLAKFGYQNDSTETIKIPIGDKNKFTPGNQDIGQPTEFFKGRVPNIISATIPAGGTLRWFLGNATVDASITTTRCAGDPVCEKTDNKDTLAHLDNDAAGMRMIARKLANRALALDRNSTINKRAQTYVARAQNLYNQQWTNVWGRFPQITENCPTCAQSDKSTDIQKLVSLAEQQIDLVRQAKALLDTANGSRRDIYADNLVAWAERIHARYIKRTQKLPRFESKCQ
jgi:hypothetical protein